MSAEHDFNALAARYELLVIKEDELHRQERTSLDVLERAIQSLIAHGQEYDYTAVEALLKALQEAHERVVVNLSRIRIKKGLLAFKMTQMKQGQD